MGKINKQRVDWAYQALLAFPPYEPDNGVYTNVKDLICDLGHYMYDQDFSEDEIRDCFDEAYSYFKAELEDDE